MPVSTIPSLVAAMSLAMTVVPVGAPLAAAADPLAAHRWKDRVLLVLGAAEDPRLRQQRNVFQAMGAEADQRDLKLVVVPDGTPQAEALRRRFGLGAGFHALLIGKDGGAKLSGDAPLRAEALIPTIDAMPMRQDEMQRRP